MTAEFLSRIQFALTSMYHYIYPPLSIGLSLMLVLFEGIYLKTKNPLYKAITQFWTNIFALTFAMGVATGLVQVFGFGTNWASYSRFVGDVFGSALAAEGIFAFFLEAGFLGIMLFGWNRVSQKIHYLATCLVTAGAHFSAIWIVVANSWMQTPAGYKIVNEIGQRRAVVTNFWEMMFNPSSIDRVIHVILGCWLAGIFLIISVSAFYALKKKYLPFTRVCLKSSLIAAFAVLILQLISGDSTARGVAKNQPEKLAAMEGLFTTRPNTPISIIGWVDTKNQMVTSLKIPSGLSLLVYRNFHQPVAGLDQTPSDEWPPIQITFQSFHLMVMMWFLMFVSVIATFFWWKRQPKWLSKMLIASVFFPQIANQVGWMTAEVGRQPWIVYKVLKTSEGVSKFIDATQVFGSILMFIIIYTFLFILFIYLLNKKIRQGPEKEATIDVYAKS